MERPGLSELSAFAAIASHRSFRKAADELGVSRSALSHMMRTLEARIGVRLLHRTTRSVTTTEAGELLVGRVRPVLRDLDHALEEVGSFRGAPRGTLRVNAPSAAR
jgi:DNA-binding transcriptional LysR family regulator